MTDDEKPADVYSTEDRRVNLDEFNAMEEEGA
jgi:hypothetical protein